MANIRPWESEFSVERIVPLMESSDLRVLEIVLLPGQCVPWHLHPYTDDLFIAVTGVLDVHVKKPLVVTRLSPGKQLMVPKKRAHLAHNPTSETIMFLNVQGIGPYDYLPIGNQAAPDFTARPFTADTL